MRQRRFTYAMKVQVHQMIEQGYTVAAIAAHVGITEKSLRTLCSRKGIRLQPGSRVIASVSTPCYHSLLKEADRMNKTIPEVVVLILEVVTRDKLFGALDIDPSGHEDMINPKPKDLVQR